MSPTNTKSQGSKGMMWRGVVVVEVVVVEEEDQEWQ
jgi:hypothetical protein